MTHAFAHRAGTKKPRSRPITLPERERILDAIAARPDDLDGVAAEFALSRATIEKLAVFARRERP